MWLDTGVFLGTSHESLFYFASAGFLAMFSYGLKLVVNFKFDFALGFLEALSCEVGLRQKNKSCECRTGNSVQ